MQNGYSRTLIIQTHWDEIIEGPGNRKIMENKTVYIKQHYFNHETTLIQIAWKTMWSTVHLELLNPETIRPHSSVLH